MNYFDVTVEVVRKLEKLPDIHKEALGALFLAILEGKQVIAPPREVQEVRNALAAYDRCGSWRPGTEKDLLEAHRILMSGLIEEAGIYRHSGVGVMSGNQVIHMAPPAGRVPQLMGDLLEWLTTTDAYPLIAGSVFHYEFDRLLRNENFFHVQGGK